ncbi:MAG: 5-Nucleotidase protein [Bacteroidetes bacterium]|jgi:2',3'-cyclic-nucleotide 2'-phosphodiesterase (5'-nucleotidase family)|nr:5-Nucleotidase protein [Bacteroidota bacterium]
MENKADRRKFIKQASLIGLSTVLPTTGLYSAEDASLPLLSAEDALNDSPASQTITLLITSDIHSQLNTHDEFFWENNTAVYRKRGGLAVLKTMIDSIRKENPSNTILYDGGDFFHGHAIASWTEGEALIPVFNKMGYDLMLPGNWEVVYKKKKMLFDLGHTNAAKICANMFHKTEDAYNNSLVYAPYWIKYIAGLKIGIIGYTDHLIPKRQSPAYSEGLKFEHAELSMARHIKHLRETENCAVVLIATHMGLAQQIGLANNPAAEGVEYIIGADTHERVREPIQGKYAKVIECGAFGSFMGRLDLVIKDGKLAGSAYKLLETDPEKYPADKEVQSLIDTAYKPYATELKKVLGYSNTPLVRYFVMETPMDNLITDAIKWKIKTDIAISSGFRFCQPLAIDPVTKQAAITKEFLWNMLPVNSEVKTGRVSGKQLWDWLEKELVNAFAKDPSKRFGGWFVRFSGMEVNFTIGNENGKRVNHVKINGKPLNPETMYTIVTCEREGDPDDTLCRIEGVQEAKKLPVFIHDIIEEYLKLHSPVAPVLESRATATDEAHTLLTQLRGISYEFR